MLQKFIINCSFKIFLNTFNGLCFYILKQTHFKNKLKIQIWVNVMPLGRVYAVKSENCISPVLQKSNYLINYRSNFKIKSTIRTIYLFLYISGDKTNYIFRIINTWTIWIWIILLLSIIEQKLFRFKVLKKIIIFFL